MEQILLLVGVIILIIILVFIISLQHKTATLEKSVNENSKSDVSLKTQGYVESLNTSIGTMLSQVGELTKESTRSKDMLENTFKAVSEMNKVMVNHKSRGNFGEYQLSNILSVYCGDNQNIYTMQYPLKNGTIVDCALLIPSDGKTKILGIDSKFPLDNYLKMENVEDESIKSGYIKSFKNDVKKHINDISEKYINSETQPYAIMFIPSEAIYQFIAGQTPELVEHGHRKKVLLVSPTTLLGVVFTIISLTKDFNRFKNAKKIEETVSTLKQDVDRLVERFEKVQSNYTTLGKNLELSSKSINKISNKVSNVYDGYVEEEAITE